MITTIIELSSIPRPDVPDFSEYDTMDAPTQYPKPQSPDAKPESKTSRLPGLSGKERAFGMWAVGLMLAVGFQLGSRGTDGITQPASKLIETTSMVAHDALPDSLSEAFKWTAVGAGAVVFQRQILSTDIPDNYLRYKHDADQAAAERREHRERQANTFRAWFGTHLLRKPR